MKESFKHKSAQRDEPEKMGRRRFLGLFSGALTTAALGGTAGLSLLKEKPNEGAQNAERSPQDTEARYDADDIEQLLESEEPTASFEGITNSKLFITEIVAEADRYERELPVVLEFAKQATAKDPEGRSRMDYVQEMLHAQGVPETAMAEIRKQMVGLAFEESRYDATRESGEHAKGILQIIPSTWNDLSNQGENVLSLVDQTRVAGELFAQTYAHLQNTVGDELMAIEAEFFHGDTDAFEQCFLAPVLINAYNAGMGTMAKLISWFARRHGSQEGTIGLLGQDKKLSGYDVFMAMAKQGEAEVPVRAYREDASAYTFKVYGAALCLLRHPAAQTAA
jgi:hypothetical protein